jgi:hypothetical protein
MVPADDPAATLTFDDDELGLLARIEHGRWVAERMALGYHLGPVREGRSHPDLVPWEELSDEVRAKEMDAARELPATLASVGFQIVRDGRGSREGAGEADFTSDEWAVLQQALMSSGVLVALAEGVVDAEEMFVLIKKLREASVGHPTRLVRELTATSSFNTGLRAGTRFADYEVPAVEAIRSATAIVATRAPGEVAGFRAFLVEIAEAVGDANFEGGFLGLGAQRRVPSEAAAIALVTRATELHG